MTEGDLKDISPGEHHCHKCKAPRRWLLRRGVQRCEACGERFPCRNPLCRHTDCECHRAYHAGLKAAQAVLDGVES